MIKHIFSHHNQLPRGNLWTSRTIMVAINLLELPLNSHLKWFLWPTSEAGRPSSNSRVSSPNTARCGKVPKGKSAVSGALQPLHVQAPITDPPPSPWSWSSTLMTCHSSAICEGQKIGPLCDSFNSYLSNLHTWFKERNLIISAQ